MTTPPSSRAGLLAQAVAAQQAGRAAEAEALCRQLVAERPDDAEALHLLGLAHFVQGRPVDAVQTIAAAIAADPTQGLYHFNMGLALDSLGMAADALGCFAAATELAPDLAEAQFRLGLAAQRDDRLDQAVERYRQVLRVAPNHGPALNNLGTALRKLGRAGEAVRHHQAAIALNPDHAEAHNNLALALTDLGRAAEAVDHHRAATRLRPDSPDLHFNLGVALDELGQVDQSVTAYRAAIALRPDFAQAHNNLALALLTRGDMAAGWREYEWRWQAPHLALGRRGFAQPQWRGEPATGKTLLVHAEQGLGDTLQFCRYVPLAAAQGLRVVLEVQKPLTRLMECLPGVARIVGQGEPLPAFDLHCPMLSLPMALEAVVKDIPASPAYLSAPPAAVAEWRDRLDTALPAGALRIGLVWAGQSRLNSPRATAMDRRRSMDPAMLAPLFALDGVALVSLQKTGPAAPAGAPIFDFMDQVGDFADTAALTANLDLVLSVDTAMAHLAGAIGRQVWLMDRADPCWRWMQDRDDSPWYPGLRIFRQPTPGDWPAVVAAIRAQLALLAANGRA